MLNLEPLAALLKANATVFGSDYGSKAVKETLVKRLNKKITSTEQVKEYTNYNIYTGGESFIVDDDLDCSESNILADHFLPPTGMEFGRESTPRAHRLYKVIDLTKKHTRSYFSFADKQKSMLVEIRANKHYTMCWGQYDNQEKVVWAKSGIPTEISWEALHKACSLLSVASVIYRKYAKEGLRNEYIRKIVATLWHHKIEQSDCERIIEAVALRSPLEVINTISSSSIFAFLIN